MKILTIVRLITSYTPDELAAYINDIRTRREIERVAVKKRAVRAKKAQMNAERMRLQRILASLSKEELATILASLGDGNAIST